MTTRSDPVPSLARRLDDLEHANRQLSRRLARAARWRGVACVALLALLASAWTAGDRGQFDDVVAGSFTLVDDRERPRAALDMDERGEPRLTLMDVRGQARIRMRLRDQEAFVHLFDAAGQNRLGLAIGEGDQPHLMVLDAQERLRYHLTTSAEGAPGMMFVGADGTICSGQGVDAKGQPWSIDEPLRAEVGPAGAVDGPSDPNADGAGSRKK